MTATWKTRNRSFYYEGAPEPDDLDLKPQETALLVIDVQNTYVERPDRAKLSPAEQAQYDKWSPFHARMRDKVIPSTWRLIDLFRKVKIECLFARIACQTNDGRDRSLSQKMPGWNNLLLPNPPRTMGEGWETRRRREPGNDWIVVRLGVPGVVEEAVVETTHFKGNYPDRCSLEALPAGSVDAAGDDARDWADPALPWVPLLDEQPLTADAAHVFARELHDVGTVSHVRLSIYPDGGISRLRLHGRPEARK